MMWIITKRAVLKKLHKMRWTDLGINARQSDFERHYYGVSSKDINLQLFNKIADEIKNKPHVNFLLSVLGGIIPYHKKYIENSIPRINQVITILEDEKYLKKDKGNYILTGKGEDMIKWYYWPRKIFTNHIVEAVLIGIIMIFVTAYITNNIINKVSTAVISNQHAIQR